MSWLEKAKQFLASRRWHYVKTFEGPAGQAVLEDLARFCRANETAFNEDPRLHALLEGRREVWLRIQQHLNLSDDDLWRLYGQHTETRQ